MSSKEFKCVSAEMLWKNELSAANMRILPEVFVQFYICHSYQIEKRNTSLHDLSSVALGCFDTKYEST